MGRTQGFGLFIQRDAVDGDVYTVKRCVMTRALHITRTSTPVSVRFSDTTGIPLIPDNDPNANPRGCAVRFHLAERVHTDIVAHSANAFPATTGQEFSLCEVLRRTFDPASAGGCETVRRRWRLCRFWDPFPSELCAGELFWL